MVKARLIKQFTQVSFLLMLLALFAFIRVNKIFAAVGDSCTNVYCGTSADCPGSQCHYCISSGTENASGTCEVSNACNPNAGGCLPCHSACLPSGPTPTPTPAVLCGDGSTGVGEGCDDGNAISGDGCSPSCYIENMNVIGRIRVGDGTSSDFGNNYYARTCDNIYCPFSHDRYIAITRKGYSWQWDKPAAEWAFLDPFRLSEQSLWSSNLNAAPNGDYPWTDNGPSAAWVDVGYVRICNGQYCWSWDIANNDWLSANPSSFNSLYPNPPAVGGILPTTGEGPTAGWHNTVSNTFTVTNQGKYWIFDVSSGSRAWVYSGNLIDVWGDVDTVGETSLMTNSGPEMGYHAEDEKIYIINDGYLWISDPSNGSWTGPLALNSGNSWTVTNDGGANKIESDYDPKYSAAWEDFYAGESPAINQSTIISTTEACLEVPALTLTCDAHDWEGNIFRFGLGPANFKCDRYGAYYDFNSALVASQRVDCTLAGLPDYYQVDSYSYSDSAGSHSGNSCDADGEGCDIGFTAVLDGGANGSNTYYYDFVLDRDDITISLEDGGGSVSKQICPYLELGTILGSSYSAVSAPSCSTTSSYTFERPDEPTAPEGQYIGARIAFTPDYTISASDDNSGDGHKIPSGVIGSAGYGYYFWPSDVDNGTWERGDRSVKLTIASPTPTATVTPTATLTPTATITPTYTPAPRVIINLESPEQQPVSKEICPMEIEAYGDWREIDFPTAPACNEATSYTFTKPDEFAGVGAGATVALWNQSGPDHVMLGVTGVPTVNDQDYANDDMFYYVAWNDWAEGDREATVVLATPTPTPYMRVSVKDSDGENVGVDVYSVYCLEGSRICRPRAFSQKSQAGGVTFDKPAFSYDYFGTQISLSDGFKYYYLDQEPVFSHAEYSHVLPKEDWTAYLLENKSVADNPSDWLDWRSWLRILQPPVWAQVIDPESGFYVWEDENWTTGEREVELILDEINIQGGFYTVPEGTEINRSGTDGPCYSSPQEPTPVTLYNSEVVAEYEDPDVEGPKSLTIDETGSQTYAIEVDNDCVNCYQVSLALPTPEEGDNDAYVCVCPDNDDNFSCHYLDMPAPNDDPINFYVRQLTMSGEAWWQVYGGHIYASGNIVSLLPSDTYCNTDCLAALLLNDLDDETDSAGLAFVEGGSVNVDDNDGTIHLTSDRSHAQNVTISEMAFEQQSYDYYEAQLQEELVEIEDEAMPSLSTDETTVLYYDGDLTIDVNDNWQVESGEGVILLINGDLTIEDPTGAGQVVTVEQGGYLAMIADGDITIAANVGYEPPAVLGSYVFASPFSTLPNVEGVFVADEELILASNGDDVHDRKFIGAGSFVGWQGVQLNRSFQESSTIYGAYNLYNPTEVFIFRPDLVVNAPAEIEEAQYEWQEVAPEKVE